MPDEYPRLRTATFRALSGWSRHGVAAMHLPDWEYDDTFTVRLALVRYKRSQ
jgi:hypothetical protein